MNQIEIIRDIESCFQTKESYPKIKKYKDAFKDQQVQVSPIICEAIQSTMTEGSPMSKLLALRLCKELMDTRSEGFSKLVSERLLSKIKQIALFRKNDTSELRGKFLFSDNPTKELGSIGNSLMKLCLDCIKVWAIWYPMTSFKDAYDELIEEGVTFPIKYTYFPELNPNPSSLGQSMIQSIDTIAEQPMKQSKSVDAKQVQQNVKQEITLLGEILQGVENDESVNYLKLIMDNFITFREQLEQTLMTIIESGDTTLINDLVIKQDILEKLIEEYQKYIQNKSTWKNFVKKYQELCPLTPQMTPQPQASIILPQKVKQENLLSTIKEEINQDEQVSKLLEQSKLIQDKPFVVRSVHSGNANIDTQQKTGMYKSLQLEQYKQKEDIEIIPIQNQQSQQNNLIKPNSFLESNPQLNKELISNYKEDQQISRQHSQVLNSEDQFNLLINQKIDIQSQKTQNLDSNLTFQKKQQSNIQQKQSTIQDFQSEKIENSEAPINQLQESRINQRKSMYTKNDQIYEIPSELQNSYRGQKSISLSQVSQRRGISSVQPSISENGQRMYSLSRKVINKEIYSSQFEIDLLKQENSQLKSDLNHIKELFEQKQKSQSEQVNQHLQEISKLKQQINENEFNKNDKKVEMVQQFQETEKIIIELQTLQYKHVQLQQQYEQLQIKYENLFKENSLKQKQITLLSKEASQYKDNLKQIKETKKRSESVGQYSKTAQQFYPYNTICKESYENQAPLTESQKNLIYPFISPQDYYRDRLKNKWKGTLILSTSDWKKISLDQKHLMLFKQALLKNQALLFKNKQIEIGCKLSLLNSNNVILHLYFMNANKLQSYDIDCTIFLANEVLSKTQKIKQIHLYQESSEELIIEYHISKLQFGISTMNLIIQSNKQSQHILYLPISVFPYISYVNTTLREYKYYWKSIKSRLIRTDPFSYNLDCEQLIFNKYIQVIELNSHKKKEFLAGLDEIKYGSLIQCRESTYLIRYVLQPTQHMILQMGLVQGRQDNSQFILDSYMFILQQ